MELLQVAMVLHLQAMLNLLLATVHHLLDTVLHPLVTVHHLLDTVLHLLDIVPHLLVTVLHLLDIVPHLLDMVTPEFRKQMIFHSFIISGNRTLPSSPEEKEMLLIESISSLR